VRGLPRTLVALLCTIGMLVAAPSLAAAHPLIGIGDNNTEMFGDPSFLALGIKLVRYDVPWDALAHRGTLTALTVWLDDARADGLTPLVSFDHVGISGNIRSLPSVASYSAAFRAFRRRFPWVTQFVTWDEVNYYSEATAFDPQRVAGYYLALRHDCASCTVLAADLVDVPRDAGVPLATWAHEFIRYAHVQPEYWGLNNYVGANDLSTASTRALLGAVRGKIWFAETGGIVSHRPRTPPPSARRARRAATVDRFILDRLARLSARIQRVYLYQWSVVSPKDSWDSALISYRGDPRPAYDVLASTLQAWGVAPDCAISGLPPTCTEASIR
jgi:hypothetical protein